LTLLCLSYRHRLEYPALSPDEITAEDEVEGEQDFDYRHFIHLCYNTRLNPEIRVTVMALERLQKILASAGVASRRKCEELILEGLIRVNGKIVEGLPAFADLDKDVIMVGGTRVRQERKVYFLLNKPKGVICTNFDPQHRTKAIDLIPSRQRIFCVGRLDVETTGLIILTNDTDMANRLTHPKYGLNKTYLAEVKGRIDTKHIEKLKKGIWLSEGKTSQTRVEILNRGPTHSLIEVRMAERLNRQVRRMLARVGLPVKSLKRTGIGRITDRGLGIGKFRLLSPAEVEYLKRATKQTELPAKARQHRLPR
jgi:23S rRNA pseudouridine2605 synthase